MDSELFGQHIAMRAAYANRFGVSIEAVDRGAALAALVAPPEALASDGSVGAHALLTLAQTSCGIAIDGALGALVGSVDQVPDRSCFTHLRAVTGQVRAAAVVQREYADDLLLELLRNTTACCRVDVALVDVGGDPVAHASFDVTLAQRVAV